LVWRVELLEGARRKLARLDPTTAQRIARFLRERIATGEDPRRMGKPLIGRLAGYWRYQVGDFRVICHVDDERLLVLVVSLGHRREIYRERP
jgi:mRNA interferase RelE/StbE